MGTNSDDTHRRAVRRGFTLIEAIVIVVILGVLAAVIAPRFLSRIGQSKQSVAAANAASLASSVDLYRADCGELRDTDTLDILWERPGHTEEGAWQGPYVKNADALIDPWGNPYELIVPGRKNAADFDIVSYGADGAPGGEGDDADITKP